jgi:hypothetical protein
MISERQKELAEWFENLKIGKFDFGNEWKGPRLDENGEVKLISEFAEFLGPWLDADFCFRFLSDLENMTCHEDYDFEKDIVTFSITEECTTIGVGENAEVFTEKVNFEYGTITEQLQEAVRQTIIWLPEESKTVIEGMK